LKSYWKLHISKLKYPQLESIKIQVDNKSAIELVKNLVHHESIKHINMRSYSIQKNIKDEEVQIVYVSQRFCQNHYLRTANRCSG
jgi:hypothetical protein